MIDVPLGSVQPTVKSAAIAAMLARIAGFSRQDAISCGCCCLCRRDASQFLDALSVREYQVSGLCQQCQDEAFGTSDD